MARDHDRDDDATLDEIDVTDFELGDVLRIGQKLGDEPKTGVVTKVKDELDAGTTTLAAQATVTWNSSTWSNAKLQNDEHGLRVGTSLFGFGFDDVTSLETVDPETVDDDLAEVRRYALAE